MSIHLISAVLAAKISNPVSKLILLKLADNANDEGLAWPSMARIAAECSVDRRTAQRHVRELEQAGLLECSMASDPERGSQTNYYRLNLAAIQGLPRAWEGAADNRPPAAQRRPPLRQYAAPPGGTAPPPPPGENLSSTVNHVADTVQVTPSNEENEQDLHLIINTYPLNDLTVKEQEDDLINNNKGERKKRAREARPGQQKFDPLAVELPECIPAELWADYCQMRRETKHPLTPTATRRILADLGKWQAEHGPEATRATLEASVRNAWRGVFPPRPQARKTAINGSTEAMPKKSDQDAIDWNNPEVVAAMLENVPLEGRRR